MDAAALGYERNVSHWPAHRPTVTESGFVYSFSSRSEIMDSINCSSYDDYMQIDNGSDKSSNLQLGRFVVIESF